MDLGMERDWMWDWMWGGSGVDLGLERDWIWDWIWVDLDLGLDVRWFSTCRVPGSAEIGADSSR